MNYDEYLNASNGLGEAVRANVVVEREVGSIEINVDSVLNWPYKFIATSGMLDTDTGTFDPETVTVFYGHINGTYIEIDEFAPGYPDIGNQANEIIVLKPTTAWADGVANRVALPPGGTTGQVLTKASDDDGDADWSGGMLSIQPKEVPSGAVDGTNDTFTTLRPYKGGTLQGYINGWAQSGYITELNPSAGTFKFDVAPEVGDDVIVYYHYDTVAISAGNILDGYTLSGILQAIFPIGATYVSGSSTMPPLIASIGTWARVNGRVIVGVDEGQTEFDTVNKTGGHKLMQSHWHKVTSRITPAGGNNGSSFSIGRGTTVSGGAYYKLPSSETTNSPIETDSNAVGALPTGGGDSENLQPYKTKYMWERTA